MDYNVCPPYIYLYFADKKNYSPNNVSDWADVISKLVALCNSVTKTLMLGKIEGRRKRGRRRMRLLDGITDSMDRSLS